MTINSTINYDVDYFIKKFQKIPNHLWGVGQFVNHFTDQKCALGHCGKTWSSTPSEAKALCDIINHKLTTSVWMVNDNRDPRYSQGSPKLRILKALEDIGNLEN